MRLVLWYLISRLLQQCISYSPEKFGTLKYKGIYWCILQPNCIHCTFLIVIKIIKKFIDSFCCLMDINCLFTLFIYSYLIKLVIIKCNQWLYIRFFFTMDLDFFCLIRINYEISSFNHIFFLLHNFFMNYLPSLHFLKRIGGIYGDQESRVLYQNKKLIFYQKYNPLSIGPRC